MVAVAKLSWLSPRASGLVGDDGCLAKGEVGGDRTPRRGRSSSTTGAARFDAKAPPLAASTETTRPSRHTSSSLQTSKSGCSSSDCVDPSLDELELTFVSEFEGDAPRSVDEPDLRGPILSDDITEAVRNGPKSKKKPPASS